MLPGKRAVRVGDQLLREIADLLLRKVKDPRIKGITLTGVHLTDDLRHAKIYYSVLGGENDVGRVQAGLESAKGFIKREVGLRLSLRYMPDIVFAHDPTLAEGSEMERIFKALKTDMPPSETE
jgi:ribosome-binding factor A